MKMKLAAYAAAAVFIGFAVMMLPRAVRIEPPSYKPELVDPFTYTSSRSAGGSEQGNQPANMDGFASRPSYNIVAPGLILAAGLAVALIVYATLRKQLK